MRAFERLRERFFRDDVVMQTPRPDARAFDQIRKITCEVGLLPRVHGSALFTRGETQALATLTLGTKEDKQRLDLLFEEESFKRFMLHYNFPPFSVGEVKFVARAGAARDRARRAGRTRAVEPASVGRGFSVRHAAGVRHSGVERLVLDGHGVRRVAGADGCGRAACRRRARASPWAWWWKAINIRILTDIAGAEDHYGDMDFKVAGTRDGITALQMDIKVGGVSIPMMREALAQAREGAARRFWTSWTQTISTPRAEISPYAPHLYSLSIPVDKIRDLIGPGGKKIRAITEETGTKIDVMEDGKVHVFAADGKSAETALKMIRDVTATAEIGKTYLGKVVRLAEFGAFVEIFPGTDGLLHISEISEQRIRAVRDELKEGDQVLVKVLGIEGNKIKLSRKAILREQREKQQAGRPAAGISSGKRQRRKGRRWMPPLFYCRMPRP